jgi:hypothetical protein
VLAEPIKSKKEKAQKKEVNKANIIKKDNTWYKKKF